MDSDYAEINIVEESPTSFARIDRSSMMSFGPGIKISGKNQFFGSTIEEMKFHSETEMDRLLKDLAV